MARLPFQLAVSSQKKVAVFSHPRSGTHFLMNALARNFGYSVKPWWNLDYEIGINFYSPQNLLWYFKQVHDKPVLNILKSHHSADFVEEIIGYLTGQFHIFYIYRDPRDVMVSYWKHIYALQWNEGPKTATVSEFIQAEPCGALLRYQQRQEDSMLRRWASHVEGWEKLSRSAGPEGIRTIRFERLSSRFEESILEIGKFLGRPVQTIERPLVNEDVIGTGKGRINSYKDHYTPEDEQYVMDQIGGLMERMDYM